LRLLPELGTIRKSERASAKAFYRLPEGQQVLVLCQVVEGVLRRSAAAPEHTQVNEAAIAAVFDAVRWLVSEEVEEDPNCTGGPIRDLVRRVSWKHLDETSIPCVGEDDLEVWAGTIEEIMDLILWDRDFEDDLTDEMTEAEAEELLAVMRIPPRYFAEAPRGPEAVASLLEDRIRAMCDAIV
jgi:hypothetical protein